MGAAMNKSHLLINERTMQVLPSLANRIGLEEAIVLQQIHYWLDRHEEMGNERTFQDGRHWVYNTIDEWQANQFTWWHRDTVKRTLAALEAMQLVETDCFESSSRNRRKWYTIDYANLKALETFDERASILPVKERIKRITDHIAQVEDSVGFGANCTNGFGANCTNGFGANCTNHLYTESTDTQSTNKEKEEAAPQPVVSPPSKPRQGNTDLNGLETDQLLDKMQHKEDFLKYWEWYKKLHKDHKGKGIKLAGIGGKEVAARKWIEVIERSKKGYDVTYGQFMEGSRLFHKAVKETIASGNDYAAFPEFSRYIAGARDRQPYWLAKLEESKDSDAPYVSPFPETEKPSPVKSKSEPLKPSDAAPDMSMEEYSAFLRKHLSAV